MLKTYLKVLAYMLEFHLMRGWAKLRGWPVAPLPRLSTDQKQTLNGAFKSLVTQWKLILKQFPGSNELSSPFIHWQRYQLILKDLRRFLTRKDKKESHDLPGVSFTPDCPEYFKRNYHYQTDGYFTEESAARYDHQIELLFLGTGHVMRKVAYASLKEVLKNDAHVLEFGAGSGTSGYQFKQLFPHTRLDLLEPGEAYLDYAKKIYPHTFNAFIPKFMEDFKPSKQYDCVYSCFVMHEIPVEHWKAIAEVIKASLKPGGHLLLIDSQQNCDKAEHQYFLDQFAEDFYEPYFAEFRSTSLETYFQNEGFKLVSKTELLFSKALLFSLQPAGTL